MSSSRTGGGSAKNPNKSGTKSLAKPIGKKKEQRDVTSAGMPGDPSRPTQVPKDRGSEEHLKNEMVANGAIDKKCKKNKKTHESSTTQRGTESGASAKTCGTDEAQPADNDRTGRLKETKTCEAESDDKGAQPKIKTAKRCTTNAKRKESNAIESKAKETACATSTDSGSSEPEPCGSAGKEKSAGKPTREEPGRKELDKLLKDTLGGLKIRKAEKSAVCEDINRISKKVVAYLKRNLDWCKNVKTLNTGSYYEHVKIVKPDEFDVMLTVLVERVDLEKFGEAGAFYIVKPKRGSIQDSMKKFLKDGYIQATEMLTHIRKKVKEAVKDEENAEVQRKKAGSPAVTLDVTNDGQTVSIDFVLGLEVKRWPIEDGFHIEKWLGTKQRTQMKLNPFYLVAKYEGRGNEVHQGVSAKDAWRISFSNTEKEMLKKHGNTKTCCEAGGRKCCRKDCLKLLKYLLKQLQEKHPAQLSKFCSYHAKTTLFHACAQQYQDSEWASEDLSACFQRFLLDFIKHLRDQNLPNFFVASQNLLHPKSVSKSNCNFLADQIKYEYENNFPIFQ